MREWEDVKEEKKRLRRSLNRWEVLSETIPEIKSYNREVNNRELLYYFYYPQTPFAKLTDSLIKTTSYLALPIVSVDLFLPSCLTTLENQFTAIRTYRAMCAKSLQVLFEEEQFFSYSLNEIASLLSAPLSYYDSEKCHFIKRRLQRKIIDFTEEDIHTYLKIVREITRNLILKLTEDALLFIGKYFQGYERRIEALMCIGNPEYAHRLEMLRSEVEVSESKSNVESRSVTFSEGPYPICFFNPEEDPVNKISAKGIGNGNDFLLTSSL